MCFWVFMDNYMSYLSAKGCFWGLAPSKLSGTGAATALPGEDPVPWVGRRACDEVGKPDEFGGRNRDSEHFQQGEQQSKGMGEYEVLGQDSCRRSLSRFPGELSRSQGGGPVSEDSPYFPASAQLLVKPRPAGMLRARCGWKGKPPAAGLVCFGPGPAAASILAHSWGAGAPCHVRALYSFHCKPSHANKSLRG